MPSHLKDLVVKESQALYKGTDNMIFVGYRGLTSLQMSELRKELRKDKVRLRVARNRLMLRALSSLGRPAGVEVLFDGPVAVMDGEDPVGMAKAALAYSKKNDKLAVKGGLVEGQVLNARQVVELSGMPGRRELQAMLVAQILSPGTAIAGALKAPATRLAGAVKALAEKLEKEQPAPVEAKAEVEAAAPAAAVAAPTDAAPAAAEAPAAPAAPTAPAGA